VDLVDFSGLIVDRCCPGHALETLWVFLKRPVTADLAEQARCELGASTGQRTDTDLAEEAFLFLQQLRLCRFVRLGLKFFSSLHQDFIE
jgi:hypothetical protein